MSAVKKQKQALYPQGHGSSDKQETLRLVKVEAERIRESLQKRIIDNPAASKKAALLISLWIQGRTSVKKQK